MPGIRDRILKRLRLKESWVIFFILGLIMLNFPFIHIFNKPLRIGGFPLLYLYLEIGWLVSIFVIYLFVKALSLPHDEDESGDDH